MLSNYNIKYVCIIYTRLDTCLMSISRFSLRDKVTLRLLKLHCYGADVVEWSRALDIRLSDLWCSVSMVWVQIPSREEKKLKAQNLILTHVWKLNQTVLELDFELFNFQTYIYILYIRLKIKPYIYVWKLNQTVLELDFRAVKFCSSLDGIWTHTIDTLQHHSLSLTSIALDHSTTSTP